jgi:hypothetical protein
MKERDGWEEKGEGGKRGKGGWYFLPAHHGFCNAVPVFFYEGVKFVLTSQIIKK